MKFTEFVAANGFWFWPCFYAGLGVALSSVIVSIFYFVYHLRRMAAKGLILNPIAELGVIALAFPGLLGVFSVAAAIGLTRDMATSSSIWLFAATGILFTVLAWCALPKNDAPIDTEKRRHQNEL